MKDEDQKEHKRTFDHINIGLAILKIIYQKFGSDKDGVGWRRILLVYSWIWDWQVFTKVGFGKMRKKDVYTEIEQKLLEPKPHVVVGALIRAGLVTWGRGEYEGKKNCCLQCTYLNEKMRNNNTNTNQAENEAIQLESSAKGSAEMGEYYKYGKRFYRVNNGDSYIIPLDAPQRPTPTAIWDGKQWCEPKSDSTEHKEKLRHSYSTWEMQNIKILGNGFICVNGCTLSDKNGEYWDFRYSCRRYIPPFPEYYREDAFCSCDKDAPPRPTPTAVWWEDEHKWLEIKDIPERPLDF